MYCSAGIMNTVSISGPSRRFISAICNSYSKSDTARRPRTITDACFRSRVVDQQAVERLHLDVRIRRGTPRAPIVDALLGP